MMSITEVKESYSRCCVNPKFFDLFYANFLGSHPSIAPMFAKTDNSEQRYPGLSLLTYIATYARFTPNNSEQR